MGEGRRCCEEGCLARTREGKPYCPDHVHLNAYVAELLGQIAANLEEVRARKALANGHVAREISAVLRDGSGAASLPRLARRLEVDRDLVRRTLHAMKAEKLVTLSLTDRGKLIAKERRR